MEAITPCLWFEGQAQEAVEFYTSVFPRSAITRVHRAMADTPGPKSGDVLFIEFTLAGRSYQALNGGVHDKFNDAISLSVACEDQAEVDRLWAALTANGGRPVACGWLKDRYGVSWQIIPKRWFELIANADAEQGRRLMQAMMGMVKLDIATLEAVAKGP
ncbi:MAG TPA: VOC family protein [Hyphomicrobiaceae bacterium]|nr:VOC family protein [Hyphomicrobiaceae bacterium]